MSETQTVSFEPKNEVQDQTQIQNFDPASFPLKTLLGIKAGMTQIYSESGVAIPVSVIAAGSSMITRIKTPSKDGYSGVQLGVGECKEKNLTKSYLGQFKKNSLVALRWLKEFKVNENELEKFKMGQKVPVEIFSAGDYVDISGISKGKGFAGAMKRHNFHGLPASHGASDKERSRGSSGGGSGQPQRVFKGTKMAGRMGCDWVTTQKIEVVKADKENQLLLVKCSVPGPIGNFVVVKQTSKNLKHKRALVVSAKGAKKAAPKKAAPKASAKG